MMDAPEIRFLTLAQIDEQLYSLKFNPELQKMVLCTMGMSRHFCDGGGMP